MDEFADFMTDTVTIEPLIARDSYGAAFYGPGVSYPCRIDGATKQMVNVNGVERSVNAMIYLSGVYTILPADRLTMPGTFDPQQPPMLKVNVFSDEAGPHHTEIAV